MHSRKLKLRYHAVFKGISVKEPAMPFNGQEPPIIQYLNPILLDFLTDP